MTATNSTRATATTTVDKPTDMRLVFDWTGPTLWRWPRCGAEVVTAEAAPRCAKCGFQESD